MAEGEWTTLAVVVPTPVVETALLLLPLASSADEEVCKSLWRRRRRETASDAASTSWSVWEPWNCMAVEALA